MFSFLRGLALSTAVALGVLAIGAATTTESAQARWGYGVGVNRGYAGAYARPYYGGGYYRPYYSGYRGYGYGYPYYGGYGGYGGYGYRGAVRVGPVGVRWW